MNEQDKAAFEEWFFSDSSNQCGHPESIAENAFEAGMAHRDKQAAQVEPVVNGPVLFALWWDERPDWFCIDYVSEYREDVEEFIPTVEGSPRIIELTTTHPAPAVAQQADVVRELVMASAGQIVKGVMLTPDGNACFCGFGEEEVNQRLANGYKHVYTEAPAVAVNEQLVKELQAAIRVIEVSMVCSEPIVKSMKKAIAAAEKAKGGK